MTEQKTIEYEEALRVLLGLVGERVVINIHAPGYQLAARFSGTLQHGNQDEWADKLYDDIGIGPAPEALFFSVNPFAFLPIEVDTEQLYGFAVAKNSFEEAHTIGRVLFVDLGDIKFVIRDMHPSEPAP